MTDDEAVRIKKGAILKVNGRDCNFRAIAACDSSYSNFGAPHIQTNLGWLKASLCEIIKLPRICLAGPMTSWPENNYPEFNRIAELLRRQGFHVENPAENDLPEGSLWNDYMRVAIAQLVKCDVVVQLEGWEKSEGAKLETDIALRLRIPTIPYGTVTFSDWYTRTMEA